MYRILAAILALAPSLAAASPDAEAGQSKAAQCAACHGADGNSVVGQWPKLAGQHADYIARQTRMVRDGERSVPEMEPMVAGLSDEDIADIAAYYAAQTVSPGVADEALVGPGRRLYQDGNREMDIPACAACHGPTGAGIPGTGFPMLRGQHADYTESRLNAYREGQTHGDDPYSEIMVAVARFLSDEEIRAVASYIEGLHPAR